MKTTDCNMLIAFPALILIGLLVATAGSQGSNRVAGIPVFALLVGLAFLIQWLVFIPAYWRQTEKFFDLTGSLTYISVGTLALFLSAGVDDRAILVWALVVIWAARLGSFLFRRIQKAGSDLECKSWLTIKKAASTATRRTKASSSKPGCGLAPATPTTSARSCYGLAL